MNAHNNAYYSVGKQHLLAYLFGCGRDLGAFRIERHRSQRIIVRRDHDLVGVGHHVEDHDLAGVLAARIGEEMVGALVGQSYQTVLVQRRLLDHVHHREVLDLVNVDRVL